MIEDMAAPRATAPTAKPQDNFLWIVIAAGVSALVLAIGLFIFASNVEYRETHHAWYLLGFFVMTIGLGISIGARRVSIAVLMGVLVALVLGISLAKFSWQKSIRETVNNPTVVTALGDYVRNISPLESHWNPYDVSPDWVKFDEECYRPALGQGSYAEDCKNKNKIFEVYSIDVMQVITDRFNLMKDTARRISTGELNNKQAYLDCVSSGSCAPVPLLPAAALGQLSPADPEYKDIRLAFWDLVDNAEMKLSLCEHMPFCKAMTTTGAVTRTDFPG